ncbi:hypothetical protein D0Z08_17465 [Nocardioides immobilis]|uniref:Uncharacterized protein n=1 Tax=Nocardioides immobilis TaxID=2049295 RepID=A0A417XZN6_9ACTN|nr:hypothetical protein [Nocardioides immobilis]RHW25825.1 hypothetical protein D0Z08_17465 [Nocardioides immobilis]
MRTRDHDRHLLGNWPTGPQPATQAGDSLVVGEVRAEEALDLLFGPEQRAADPLHLEGGKDSPLAVVIERPSTMVLASGCFDGSVLLTVAVSERQAVAVRFAEKLGTLTRCNFI